MSSTETTTEDGYEFKAKVSKNRLPDLLKAYNLAVGLPEGRRISGVATQEEKGVLVTLDTRKRIVEIFTEATEGKSFEFAKAKAAIVRKQLGEKMPPLPPPPPPTPSGRG